MVERMNVSPTLIIGLGGTGSLAVQYAKQKIRKRLESYEGAPLPVQIPFLEYLVIDTTAQEEMVEEFVPDEFLNIGRLNISRIISNLEFESDSRILNWFPKKLDPGQIDSGAGGVRHIGRLCFFRYESEIESRIRNKVKQITDSANIKNFLSEHLSRLRMEEASTIDVHLVTSLCGGTGSACLLDAAYLVRHIVGDITKQMPNSVAHLVTPEPFEGEPGVGSSSREYIQYNFAVSLSEIEHFTKKDASKPWDVEYRNRTAVHSTEKPFSVAYLLGYKEGVSLSKKQLCEIVGETIAINTVHPDGKLIKGLIENFKPHVINTEDAGQKRRTYSSYNAQILHVGVEDSLFSRAVSSGSKKILASLCEEVPPGIGELAFKQFEQGIFAAVTSIPTLDFEAAKNHLRNEIGITPGDFWTAFDAIRHDLDLPPKKRTRELPTLLARVNMACEVADAETSTKQRQFGLSLRASFKELERKTDENINSLMGEHSLPYIHALMKHVSRLLGEFQSDLTEHRNSLPDRDHNYDAEIVKAIDVGRGETVPELCAKRAQAKNHGPIIESLSQLVHEYKRKIDDRVAWCQSARECLLDANGALPEEKVSAKSSHTTSFVWTEAALNLLIEESKIRVIRRFVSLLEQEYYSDDISQKVCFLLRLNRQSLTDRQKAQDLAKRATKLQLQEEMVHNEDQMRQRALDSIHEFVELASPAWQIEKGGEDIATISVTNCPEGSESGQIMARFGKNITFSRNGAHPRELVLFRSEHGVSVNQLINFKKCLKAVSRKLHLEGKERINDLCLNPEWNIAAPLPLAIEDLRLDFTLALHFNLIKPGFEAYTFRDASGNIVPLRQNIDLKKATRRFEAFGQLLDLDCDGSEDCSYLRKSISEQLSVSTREENIAKLKVALSSHLKNLDQLKFAAEDAPEELQITREMESLAAFIEQLDKSIQQSELNSYGASR